MIFQLANTVNVLHQLFCQFFLYHMNLRHEDFLHNCNSLFLDGAYQGSVHEKEISVGATRHYTGD